jgi:DNA-binding response OmpR family regulator
MSEGNTDLVRLIVLLIQVTLACILGWVILFCIRKIKERRSQDNPSNLRFTKQQNASASTDLHAFLDPITLIIGYSDKLISTVPESKSLPDLQIINQSAHKLLRLIDEARGHYNPEIQADEWSVQEESVYSQANIDEPAKVEKCDRKKGKILIVDDDDAIRCYVKNILADYYHIVEASNGKEGLEIGVNLSPDLIISDIMMPEMDGIEFCRSIKTDIKTSHIPVVLLTARSAVEHRIQGFEVGADSYISKPFNSTELILRVKNLLETLHKQRRRYAADIFQTPRQITSNSTDEKFLSDLIRYIEDHIEDAELDISVLASELNMSSSNLYRKIKSITGMSSIDFVTNHKMKYAAHLLLSNRYSVKAVAYMVGFADSRYFSTRFKKYFHATPTEYKERFVEQNEIKPV